MKLDMSFEEFCVYFNNNPDFKDFILRVRDENDKDNDSIAYYNGIKAFFVVKDKNDGKVKLDFPLNVYTLNSTGVNRAIDADYPKRKELEEKNGKKISVQKSKAIYREIISNGLNKMNKLFDFTMKNIIFNFSIESNETDEKLESIYNFLQNFKKKLEKYKKKDKAVQDDADDFVIDINVKKLKVENYCLKDVEDFKQKIQGLLDKTNNNENSTSTVNCILKFNPILTTKKGIENIKPEKIIRTQLCFIDGKTYGIISPEFTCESIYKKNRRKNKLKYFVDTSKDAIENYFCSLDRTDKDVFQKLENRYQHQFMLNSSNMTSLFDIKNNEKVDYFEKEYGICNPEPINNESNKYTIKSPKEGRIDCITYKYTENKNNEKKVSDIYMIELKINTKVMDGNNGILIHLDDIHGFLNYNKKSPNYNENYASYTLKKLKKRIEYRNKILFNKNVDFAKDLKLHFYTVIGYSNEKEHGKIRTELDNILNDPKTKELVKELLAKGCEIKFYLDEKKFDPNCNSDTVDDKERFTEIPYNLNS